MRHLLAEFRGSSGLVALIVGLSFVCGVLETAAITLAVATLSSVVMAEIAAGDPSSLLGFSLPSPWVAVQLGVAAVLVRWLLAVWNDWLIQHAVTRWTIELRSRLLTAFLHAEWRLQAEERSAAVQERLFQSSTQVSSLMATVLTWLQSAITVLVILGGALAVNAVGAVAAAVVSVVLVVMVRPLNAWISRSAERALESMLRSAELVRSCLELVRELRVFGSRDSARRAMLDEVVRQDQARRQALFFSAFSGQLYFTLVMLACWGALAVVLLLEPARFAELGAVGLLLLRSLGYTRSLHTGSTKIRGLLPTYEDLRRFERRLAGLGREREVASGRTPEDTDLVLEGVGFQYPGSAVAALEGVELTIPAGTSFAVVGPSGSGKSTLAQIVLGLRRPTAGRFLVGGIAEPELDPAWWRSATAVVTQENLLLDASVLENVRFYRQRIDEAVVWRALAEVGLEEFVRALPEGLLTRVGQHGARLSGGQRQRLCIARALVGAPRILVLDEPTSALDVHSEQVVQQCLDRLAGRCTRIVIAHRLSTIRSCERVLVLDHGRILDLGSPAELEQRLGYFREALSLSSG